MNKPKVFEIISTAGFAGGLFALLALLLQPLPIPSLTSSVGGLLGFWLARQRRHFRACVGAFAGVLVGVGLHAYQHFVEGRLDQEGGLPAHLASDAGFGLVIAGPLLAVVLIVYPVIVNRLTSGAATDITRR